MVHSPPLPSPDVSAADRTLSLYRLFNCSQPRRALPLAELAVHLSHIAMGARQTFAAVSPRSSDVPALMVAVTAAHMQSHCYLQIKPPRRREALEFAGRALRSRVALAAAASAPVAVPAAAEIWSASSTTASAPPAHMDAPNIQDLVSAHVSIQMHLLSSSDASVGDEARGEVVGALVTAFGSDCACTGACLHGHHAVEIPPSLQLVQEIAAAEGASLMRWLLQRPAHQQGAILQHALKLAAHALANLPVGSASEAHARVLLTKAEMLWFFKSGARCSETTELSGAGAQVVNNSSGFEVVALNDAMVALKLLGTNIDADNPLSGSVGGESPIAPKASDGSTAAVQAHASKFDKFKVAKLKEELFQRGLSTDGKRSELLARLHDASVAEAESIVAKVAGNNVVVGSNIDQPCEALDLQARALLLAAEVAMHQSARLMPEAIVEHRKSCVIAAHQHGRAASLATKAVAAWQLLLEPKKLPHDESLCWPVTLRSAMERIATMNALLRCSYLLWQLMLDLPARAAARLAARAAIELGNFLNDRESSQDRRTREVAIIGALR